MKKSTTRKENIRRQGNNERNMKTMQAGFAPGASKKLVAYAEEARVNFIEENKGLGVKVLGKYMHSNPDIADDIWQVAYVETAANLHERYCADKGVPVSAYLSKVMSAKAKKFIVKTRRPAGVTDTHVKQLRALHAYMDEYEREHGCQPSFEEARCAVSKMLGNKKPIDKEYFMEVWLMPPLTQEAILDAPINQDEDDDTTLLDLLAAKPVIQEDMYSNTHTRFYQEAFHTYLSQLDERDRVAIAAIALMRYPSFFPGITTIEEKCSWSKIPENMKRLGFCHGNGRPYSRETWRKKWEEFIYSCNKAYTASITKVHASGL